MFFLNLCLYSLSLIVVNLSAESGGDFMAISLGKVLRKRGFSSVVKWLASGLNGGVVIEDSQGKELLASGEIEGGELYPVMVGDEQIGQVKGEAEVEPLALLLAYEAEKEMERRGLVAETLHKYKEITLLYELVEQVASCLHRQQVARLVIAQARRVISFDRMSLWVRESEGGDLELLAAHTPDGGEESGGERSGATTLRIDQGVVASVLASGQAEIVNEVDGDPRFVAGANRISSLMCAPLKTSEAVIGVACLSSEQSMNYTAEDLKLFSTLTYQAAVAIENASLYEQLQDAFYTTVYTLAETIEKRDPYTGNHTKRVMEYSLAIGKTLELEEGELTRLQLAAVLHDVGKIGVRDKVLLKEGPLDDDEFAQIKRHSAYGAEIVRNIKQMQQIIPGVRNHHERFDGRGYPDGLKGEEIDIIARIIAVADTFDAMITDRPYRKGLDIDIAFAELRRNAGTQFDPRVVEAFFATDIMDAYYSAGSRSRIIRGEEE